MDIVGREGALFCLLQVSYNCTKYSEYSEGIEEQGGKLTKPVIGKKKTGLEHLFVQDQL